MQQREAAALPEGVAAVDQLIGPPLEAALACHLSVREPLSHQVELEQVRTAQQHLVRGGITLTLTLTLANPNPNPNPNPRNPLTLT